jgi:hypothetical protein
MSAQRQQALLASCHHLVEMACKDGFKPGFQATAIMPNTPGATVDDALEAIIICQRGSPMFDALMNLIKQGEQEQKLAEVGNGPKPSVQVVPQMPRGL